MLTAHERVIVSTYVNINQPQWHGLTMSSKCHRIDAEDACDFVPLGPLIGLPSQLLGQGFCELVYSVFDLVCRILKTSQAAGKGRS